MTQDPGAAGSMPEGADPALRIRVWIDFVCPFCFLAEEPLRQAIEGLDVQVDWEPFELRPFPEPTLRPEGEYLQTAWSRSVYPIAERMGIPIRLPDVSPQPYSRLAFEGLPFAKAHGRATEYVDAVMRAFFQRSIDIGQVDELVSIAKDVGLPADEFRAALAEKRYARDHDAALLAARAMSIRAVPTMLVGDQRIEGMASAEPLRRFIEHKLSPVGA
jgi:predicted DsbA family dithiol-disulfide isomerase